MQKGYFTYMDSYLQSLTLSELPYSRLTGLDAKFTAVLRFLCTRKYLDASSLKHIVFMQKPFKNPGEILR